MSYVYRRRWQWVEYPVAGAEDAPANHDPEYTGFKFEVLSNPQGGEVHDEDVRWRDVVSGRAPLESYLEAIAERVKSWNYQAEELTSGAVVDVPAPGAGDWKSFYLLPSDLMYWMIAQIKRAHLPKVMTTSSARAGTTDTGSPSESDPEPARLAD